MKNRTLATVGSFAAVVTLFALSSVPTSAQAIYTTTSTGTTVNANQFTAKDAVYLNGGPQNQNGPGFTPGNYYFQVTDPSGGTLLSTDSIFCRQLVVNANGVVSGVPAAPDINCPSSFHAIGTTNIANGSTGIQLIPFADTPNGGGVYKVWITAVADWHACSITSGLATDATHPATCSGSFGFGPANIKTDNFKIGESTPCTENCGPPPQSTLSGVKYYDKARNGVLDVSDDAPVQGVTIKILSTGTPSFSAITTTTDAGGAFTAVVPLHAPFQVCEDKTVAPFTSGLWEQTGPLDAATAGLGNATATAGCWNGIAEVDFGDLNFGNVAKITGTKYYDTNANGAPDGGEPTANGFKVTFCANASCPSITADALTAGSGTYSFYLPTQNATYLVCEATAASPWFQTGPIPPATVGSATAQSNKCWSGTGPLSGLYLTNVCRGAGGGLTLGFWSNKNGQKITTAADLAFLAGLNLRNGDGTNFDPTTTGQLSTWLLNGNAVNMANMLSVQLAAMELNTRHTPGVSASALIYAPGTNSANLAGYATVQAVMDEANTLLGSANPLLILSGSSDRPRAEALKNALDNANNNLTFVQAPGTCAAPVYQQ